MKAPCYFRPSRYHVVALILAAFVFLGVGSPGLFGVAQIVDGGDLPDGHWQVTLILGFFFVVGLLVAIGACRLLMLRVVVYEWGISKSWLWQEFALRWDVLESWSVEPWDESWKRVMFQPTTRRWPCRVYDYEVCVPGFDQFLNYLDALAGEKQDK